ncbi:MAG: GLPGLI family protein [Bacteroidales bacterium]|nr:GLPGLI family protein [Bacteroidales bacterium]
MGANFNTFQKMSRYFELAGKMQELSQIPTDRFIAIITYSIYKNYPAGNLTYINNVIPNIFLNEEKPNGFDWRLNTETAVIQGYDCQKTTTHYGGQYLSIWHTVDLNYNDGSHKFGGMPGMIVKLVDEKAPFKFELLKLEISENETFIELKKRDYVKTNRIYFSKAAANFRQDIIIQTISVGIESNEDNNRWPTK